MYHHVLFYYFDFCYTGMEKCAFIFTVLVQGSFKKVQARSLKMTCRRIKEQKVTKRQRRYLYSLHFPFQSQHFRTVL